MTSQAEGVHAEAHRRAIVIGIGLIGGSIALGLRQQGWHVSGIDLDPSALTAAIELGVLDAVGDDPDASLALVCVPAAEVVTVVEELLASHPSRDFLISDVAGVKSSIVEAIIDPRFIGGHPMAGSEQIGVTGARDDLFLGATWVLTPDSATSPDHFSRLVMIIRSLGAQVLSLSGSDHDRLVALVSHLPHLVAASLMNEASAASESDAALLQLAAGGFRDMTRVAAGDPGIWPDVCIENKAAIIEGLDDLRERLDTIRGAIAASDSSSIHRILDQASVARRSLPGRATDPKQLAQIRIPVPDRPGVIAEVTATASDLGVSLYDVEIAHSVEGDRGVLIVVVGIDEGTPYVEALRSRGFQCTVTVL
jgi:prephenate dehydrogenase